MSYVKTHMAESIKNHVLEEIPAGEQIKAFYMKTHEGGRMMSTLFLFTPEGIVIMGDLCPGGPKNSGSISVFGYGLSWFASELSEDYLCSKFMVKTWVREYAMEYVDDILKELEAGKTYHGEELSEEALKEYTEKFKELRANLDDDYTIPSSSEFYTALSEINESEVDDGVPGCGYEPGVAGWLCALQQKFSELYLAKVPQEKA